MPLDTGPWTPERLHEAARRGSHKSAKDAAEFVCEEMLKFCAQGFWTVPPLHIALTLHHLRLSPLGVVPQRDRRPRLIVDYTFSKVNKEIARLAPPEAMQFGKTLQRNEQSTPIQAMVQCGSPRSTLPTDSTGSASNHATSHASALFYLWQTANHTRWRSPWPSRWDGLKAHRTLRPLPKRLVISSTPRWHAHTWACPTIVS